MLTFASTARKIINKLNMGNIALAPEDLAFLKGKSNKKASTGDIKKAFNEFIEDLDVKEKGMADVRINFEQFCDKCDTVFNIESQTLQNDREEVYRHLFRAFDGDSDGFVSFKEFVLGLLILGGNSATVDEDALNLMFRLHDNNGDGSITVQEAERMSKFFRPTSKDSAVDWFNYVDEDQNGFIDLQEFVNKGKRRLQDVRRNSAFFLE